VHCDCSRSTAAPATTQRRATAQRRYTYVPTHTQTYTNTRIHRVISSDTNTVRSLKYGWLSLNFQAPTSSWGAATLLVNGSWHSYVAEITLGCGMAAWSCNSRIVHAVSDEPLTKPFVRQDEVAPVFAHEPAVALAPNGSIVLWFTATDWPSPRPLCTACNGGQTTTASRAPNGSCTGGGSTDSTFMMHADSPYGPWSPPVRVLSGRPGSYVPRFGGDTNLAMVLLPNGSAIGMMRVLGESTGDSR
jgi:hypothetical protein